MMRMIKVYECERSGCGYVARDTNSSVMKQHDEAGSSPYKFKNGDAVTVQIRPEKKLDAYTIPEAAVNGCVIGQSRVLLPSFRGHLNRYEIKLENPDGMPEIIIAPEMWLRERRS